MENLKKYLEISMKEKKGVTLFLNGNKIAGIVLNMDLEGVELKNQEYSKIYVSLDKILALAI